MQQSRDKALAELNLMWMAVGGYLGVLANQIINKGETFEDRRSKFFSLLIYS